MDQRKAIVSVIGKDKVGIIAKVTAILASNHINILDISQIILQDFFTMLMLIDVTEIENFNKLRDELDAGELIGRVVAKRLDVPFGIMDLSLAPMNALNDSVAEILEEIGLERVGTHGTIAALALMNDAVKKGGAMASSYVGGLSGAFIPFSSEKLINRGGRIPAPLQALIN